MFGQAQIFTSFSVDDIDAARRFYGDTLGLTVTDAMMGNLDIAFAGGGHAFVYVKDDHVPASFTVLNIVTDNVDTAVDELNVRGVVTKIYGDDELTGMPANDEKGIMRDEANSAQMAWFKDPAGNVLAVLAGGTPE